MRFASLGSGSEGNSLVVEVEDGTTTSRIMLDCGFSARETRRRLERLGLQVEDLDALLITHEHADHIGSALTLARKYGIPLYTSWGTALATGALCAVGPSGQPALSALSDVSAKPTDLSSAFRPADAFGSGVKTLEGIDLRLCESAVEFSVGNIQITPFTVPHDAREPLQFVFSCGARRLGVLTDVGVGTPLITATLMHCDALVLECNHDREMLANSRYHAALKARIGGSHGHLANHAAAEILSTLNTASLKHIIAAHLSRENNRPELAQEAVAPTLNAQAEDVIVASQDEGFGWLSI